MNMLRRIKRRVGSGGFTALEVIIVLAIMAALAAVAVIGTSSIIRKQSMIKLDTQARELFSMAQNRITSMHVTGELDALDAAELDSRRLSDADFHPQDLPAGKTVEELYYFESGSSIADVILPADSLDFWLPAGSNFIVEFSLSTGEVYGVFYAESAFTYATVMSLENRESETRAVASPVLGYYGGIGETDATSDGVAAHTGSVFNPISKLAVQIAVYNGEELYLQVKTSGISAADTFALTVTLTDEHGGVWKTNRTALDDATSAYYLLDSLQSGVSFAALTGLTPGDTVVAHASLVRSVDGIPADAGEATTAGFNSLFASKTGTDLSETISVGTVRHLRNLSVYHAEKSTVIRQTNTIDFSGGSYAWEETASGIQYVGDGNGNCPITSFSPISNESLFGNTVTCGYATEYNGNGNALKNFVIVGGTGMPAGLFKMANGVAFSRITFVNPALTASGDAGILAGTLYDSSVNQCGVYLDNGERAGSFASPDRGTHCINGGTRVGGLVGYAEDCTIDFCFAAIDVGGITSVGGLVGALSGGAIQTCYASGNAMGDAAVGALCGTILGDAIIENTYSTGTVNDADGKLVGAENAYTGTIKGSIAYFAGNCDVYDAGGVPTEKTLDSLIEAGGFSPLTAGTTYPYSAAIGSIGAFPYTAVLDTHYGDFPY